MEMGAGLESDDSNKWWKVGAQARRKARGQRP